MNNKRIRMPLGAALACFFVTALIIAGIITAGKYIFPRCDIMRDPSMTGMRGNAAVTANPGKNTAGSPDTISYAKNTSGCTDEYDMIEKSMKAAVSIDNAMKSGFTSVLAGSGSGVIVSEDGYILTCNHVIAGSDQIYVYLNDGKKYEADIVGVDIITDIAVLKIEASGLTFATLGDSSTLRVGESVYAIGNALGELSNTYTSGSVSGLDRNIEIGGQMMTLLQTDAAINKGNSGGGFFRASDGTLVGIVNAKSIGNGIEGLGFVIPSNLVFTVSQDLIQYGFVTGRPYIGVNTEDVTLSGGFGLFGSYYTYPRVTSIDEGSPAEAAGFSINDIILAIDGTGVSGAEELVQLVVNQYKIGDRITVTVRRGNTNVDLNVILGERGIHTD